MGPDNTLETFQAALAAGVSALESDAWVTADGVVVLDHDGVAPGLRRKRISDVNRDRLPTYVPSLDELYRECGTDFDLALDLRDPRVADPVVAAAKKAGHSPDRLWLVAADDWEAAGEWKQSCPEFQVVDSTRRRAMKAGTERRAAQMAEVGIDGVNLHYTDWSVGLVTLFHRFEILCFAWDCQFDHVLRKTLSMGVDGVFSDHPDRLIQALGEPGD